MPADTPSNKSAQKWIGLTLVLIAGLVLAAYFLNTVAVRAQNAEMRKFKLPDHSQMILNSGSGATYHRWTAPRELTLEGEGFFDLSKGNTFTVHTAIGTVTASHAKFNVRARGKKLEVSCFEGKVKITSGINSSDLMQNYYIVFEGKEMGWPTPENRKLPGWMQQQIVFNNEKIKGVTAELERKFNIKIRLDAAESAQRFTGWLPAKDREEALRIVCEVFYLTLSKTNNGFVLTGPKTN